MGIWKIKPNEKDVIIVGTLICNSAEQKSEIPQIYIIIGNGAAGYYAAGTIRKNCADSKIIMISEEKVLTYYRPQLSDLLTEELPEKRFYISPEAWYKDNNIELILGLSVIDVFPSLKTVKLSDGRELSYHKLILANGSSNFIPPVKGRELSGVYTLKYLKDAQAIKLSMKEGKNAVVAGGGLLGLEAAWEMKKSGMNVAVVEFCPRLLPKQLDEEGGELFKKILDNSDIELILGDCAEEILSSEKKGCTDKVSSVKLKSGRILPADLILFSVGIRPNKGIAEKAGIACNKGILVNEFMETASKDIYACGDVAELDGKLFGNWTSAIEMGKTAGRTASGEKHPFKDFVFSVIFRGMNADIFSAGTIDYEDPSLEILSSKDIDGSIYKKLFFKDNKLIGGILMGSTAKAAKLTSAIRNGKGMEDDTVKDILQI